MENFGYLFAAYTIIFAAIAIYVLFIWRRQARLDAELRALERRIEELGGGTPGRPARNTR
jgi:CcmD family protein